MGDDRRTDDYAPWPAGRHSPPGGPWSSNCLEKTKLAGKVCKHAASLSAYCAILLRMPEPAVGIADAACGEPRCGLVPRESAINIRVSLVISMAVQQQVVRPAFTATALRASLAMRAKFKSREFGSSMGRVDRVSSTRLLTQPGRRSNPLTVVKGSFPRSVSCCGEGRWRDLRLASSTRRSLVCGTPNQSAGSTLMS
jgi:hypothetical protein